MHADRLNVLPLGVYSARGRTIVSFAFAGDNVVEVSDELRFLVGSEVSLTSVPQAPLKDAIHIAYHGDDSRLRQTLAALPAERTNQPSVIDFRSANGDAANLLTILVDLAVARCASDIHLIPVTNGSIIRLRINGELLTQREPPCPTSIHVQVVSRVKILAQLDTTLRTKPQDGSFQIRTGSQCVSVRVSVMPTVHGESLALRLLPNQSVPSMPELGFDQECQTFLNGAITLTDGLILFVGPTGSGKTTSMYSCINTLVQRGLHVVTIEEPVEIQLDGITQVSLNSRIGFDYPTALRAVLRQDPDVILVGEIRDHESARISYEAALTGHLLFGTVHAKSAPESISRLEALGVSPQKAAEILRLVVHQRLLPKLCQRCKVIDLNGARKFGDRVYQPVGCDGCGYSGFDGQVIIPEMLKFDDRLLSVCEHAALSARTIRENINSKNYRPLTRSLELALRGGTISAQHFLEFVEQEI